MKKVIIRSVIGTAFVLSLVAHPVGVLVGGFSSLKNNPSSTSTTESIAAARVKINTARKLNISFTSKKNVPLLGNSIFLQGSVSIRGKEYPASAAIINNKLRVTFAGLIHGSRKSRQRLYTLITSPHAAHRGRLSSIPISVAHGRVCTNHAEHENSPPAVMALNEGLPSHMSHVVTIHTYADQEWLAKYGSYSQEEVVNVINTAEAIYTRQLGIRFRIVGHNNYFTIEKDASKILGEFQKNRATQNNNTDLKHLFTAKDMTGYTIGLAYLTSVCAYPEYAYGVTQDYYVFTPYTFAHEIGHNFGAFHTSSGLMSPTIGSHSSSGFSNASLNQINNHLTYSGSCLSLEETKPNLSIAKLLITYKERTISGRLLSASNKPIANQRIKLVLNTRVVSIKTSSDGSYKFSLKTRGRYVSYAVTSGGEKKSRTIRFTVR